MKTSSNVSTEAKTGTTPDLTPTSQSNPSATFKLSVEGSFNITVYNYLLQQGVGMSNPSPGSHILYKSASRDDAAPGAIARCSLSTGISGLKCLLKNVTNASSRSRSPANPFGYEKCSKQVSTQRTDRTRTQESVRDQTGCSVWHSCTLQQSLPASSSSQKFPSQ